MHLDSVAENKAIAQEYKELLRISYQKLTPTDKKLIRLAFDTAVDAHKNQRRKSGEPYIFHPITVAKIVCSEIGMDATSIVSALLHDVVEDTDVSINQIKLLFGKTVAKIVDGLTKIPQIDLQENISAQAENFKKILLTLDRDIRIVIIKIADRLHNMQTIDSMSKVKQIKIASETLYIYAPMAHRLGLYNIKSELEDLSLRYTERETFDGIKAKIEDTKEEQNQYIDQFKEEVYGYLKDSGINCSIVGRPKSIYSIHLKMKQKKCAFEDIYDKFAIRIIYQSKKVEEKFLSWKIYSIITEIFKPNPLRLRDWITSPKSNGYEALHITVMGPLGKWVEIQIRSERMNEIAEFGYAAHFKYKHDNQYKSVATGINQWINQLQELFENTDNDAVSFVKEFKLDLYNNEIFVFTPQGDLRSLPEGATPIDFAFAVHTQIGLHAMGVKVNNAIVPLNHTLKTGDQVQILISEHVLPNPSWLEFVKTTKARSSIRMAIKKNENKKIEKGKELLKRKLSLFKIDLDQQNIDKLIRYFKLKSSKELYVNIVEKVIDNDMLKNFVSYRNSLLKFFRKSTFPNPKIQLEQLPDFNHSYQVVFENSHKVLDYRISVCCKPIPGDNIFGFKSKNGIVNVHKFDCKNAVSIQSNYSYNILPAEWIYLESGSYVTQIRLSGIDKTGLVNEVTTLILNAVNVDMQSIKFDVEREIFHGSIGLKVKNTNSLNIVIDEIRKLDGIDKVERV